MWRAEHLLHKFSNITYIGNEGEKEGEREQEREQERGEERGKGRRGEREGGSNSLRGKLGGSNVVSLGESLRSIGDERVITKMLLECGSIEECEVFVSKIAQLQYITTSKLIFLLERANGDLGNALRCAQLFDEHHRDSQRGAQNMTNQVRPLDTKGDGACFFRAIAYALTNEDRFRHGNDNRTKSYLRSIRIRFVEAVIQAWNDDVLDSLKLRDIVGFEHDKHTPEEYRKYMELPDTWAGQPEVMVAGNIYGLTVYQKQDGQFVKHTYGNGKRKQGLHIFFNGSNHYSALMVKK